MRPASMGADGSRITEFPYTATQGNGDVNSSYHIYASCFSAIMWGKL